MNLRSIPKSPHSRKIRSVEITLLNNVFLEWNLNMWPRDHAVHRVFTCNLERMKGANLN